MSDEVTPRRRGLLVPALFTLVGVAVLAGLGTWQLNRLAWKQNVIASIETRIDAPPVALPTPEHWRELRSERDEFRHVTFAGEFLNDRETLVYTSGSALRSDVTGSGYWVFTPARIGGGDIVMVNRGYVPEQNRDPASRAAGQTAGVTDVEGVLRWPEAPGWFTPAGDPGRNIWFARDHQAMAAAKGLSVAPFYVDQDEPVPPGGLPRPGRLVANLPNNHLQYAITWYALALVLLGVFVAYALGQRRQHRIAQVGKRA